MAGSRYNNQHKWTNWRRENFIFFKKRFRHLNKNLTLLDIGSGPEQFRELTWQFKHVISVDFKQYGTTKIITDLTKKIPLDDGSVDIVYISNALEHLPDGRFTMQECFRLLCDGGMIIGTIPFLAPEHQGPYDFNRYTHYMLEILLRDAGFFGIEIIPIGRPAQVYINIINDFFRKLRSQHVSKNQIIQSLYSRFIGCIRLINLALFALFRPIYDLAELNYQFVQGYGFVGYKKIMD